MAKYRITAPDGGTYEVTAPEGASEAEVMAYAQANYKPKKADFSGVTSTAETVSRAAPPSMLDRAGRELGLGARATLGGIASTAGIVTDPLASMAGLPSAREGADALSDTIGLPTPQTATERVGGDITSALAGGGGLIGLGRGLATRAPGAVSGVGNMLASMPGTQLASAAAGSGAAGTTREAGGSQGTQLAAGLIGGLGTPAVRAGVPAAIRGAVRGGEGSIDQTTGLATGGRKLMEQNIRDFNSVGASPSVGQATQNFRTQGLESLLAGGPTSSGVMTRAAERQAESIGGGLQRLADDFTPGASRQSAGEAIEKGVATYADNVRATKNALYWKADKLIPANTALPLSRTWQALDEIVSPTPGALSTTGGLINPKIAAMAKNVADDLAANGGQMPYEAVRALRSRIGTELSDFSLTTDKPTAEYKKLYAALSQDLEEAARRQGPEAERAARKANNYTKRTSERLEHLNRVVNKNGGAEKVYAAVMSGAGEGNTTIKRVMYSLPKESQQALTAAVIKRMGMARPGAQDDVGEVFSADTFLTKWNADVSPEAKRVLFGRHGPKFVENMNKVARVASNIKSGSKVFANPSGSAKTGAAYAYFGSLPATALLAGPGALAIQVLGGIGANGAARLMNNPAFVSWLASATRMPVSAVPQQAVILKGIASQQGDDELMQVAEALEQQHPNQPANAGNRSAEGQ